MYENEMIAHGLYTLGFISLPMLWMGLVLAVIAYFEMKNGDASYVHEMIKASKQYDVVHAKQLANQVKAIMVSKVALKEKTDLIKAAVKHSQIEAQTLADAEKEISKLSWHTRKVSKRPMTLPYHRPVTSPYLNSIKLN